MAARGSACLSEKRPREPLAPSARYRHRRPGEDVRSHTSCYVQSLDALGVAGVASYLCPACLQAHGEALPPRAQPQKSAPATSHKSRECATDRTEPTRSARTRTPTYLWLPTLSLLQPFLGSYLHSFLLVVVHLIHTCPIRNHRPFRARDPYTMDYNGTALLAELSSSVHLGSLPLTPHPVSARLSRLSGIASRRNRLSSPSSGWFQHARESADSQRRSP